MKPDVALSLTSLGMVSPLGVNAAQTFCAVRANIPRKAEHPDIYMCLPSDVDLEEAQPLVASAISHLDHRARRDGDVGAWLVQMAAQAFVEAWAAARLTEPDERRTGVFISLPEIQPDGALKQVFQTRFCDLVALDGFAHMQFSWPTSGSGLAHISEARRMLATREIDRAFVGGVDSYLFAGRLAPLDRAYRLASARARDGFCPGEAAAFFLVELPEHAKDRGARTWAEIRDLSSTTRAADPSGHDSGKALAMALGPAISGTASGTAPAPLIVCDLNGETFRAREWGYAVSKLGRSLSAPLAIEHPAAILGDMGAATGAALVVLAALYLHTKHRDRKSSVVWTAGDGGVRHALLLDRVVAPSGSPLSP